MRSSDNTDVLYFLVASTMIIAIICYFFIKWALVFLIAGIIFIASLIAPLIKNSIHKIKFKKPILKKSRLFKKKNKFSKQLPLSKPCADNNSSIYKEDINETQTIHNNNPVVHNNHLLTEEEELPMATHIAAGKYIFDEDIPLGKYNLKVISGNGMLIIQPNDENDGDEIWLHFGINKDYAQEYRNLSLPKGRYFTLDGNLNVEITKSEMLKID